MRNDWQDVIKVERRTLRQTMLVEFDEAAGLTMAARADLELVPNRELYLFFGGQPDGDQMRVGHSTSHLFLRAAAPDQYERVKQTFAQFYLMREASLERWFTNARALIAYPNSEQPLPNGHPLNDVAYKAAWDYILRASEHVRHPEIPRRLMDHQEMKERFELIAQALGAER